MHLNGEYVRSGPVEAKQFFTLVDLTDQAANLAQTVEDSLDDMGKAIRLPQSPDVQIGCHCDDPYTCPLHDKCWSFLPEQNVTTLYRAGKKGFRLLEGGFLAIKDIPDDFPLTSNQKIRRHAVLTADPHIDRPALAAFLSHLKHPLSYVDFETFGTAIPLFDDTQPYQQIPFQFSLQVVRSPGAEPEHYGFLAEGRDDPRPEFLRSLRTVLPEAGSVIAYNAGFEQGRLEEYCDLLPKFRPWYGQVKRRMVDLLLLFRGFRYYHADQLGSASMKAVLPAWTGRGYGHLAIQEGGTASLEFLRVTFGDAPEAERKRVPQALNDYCALDTLGMVDIIDALRRLTS